MFVGSFSQMFLTWSAIFAGGNFAHKTLVKICLERKYFEWFWLRALTILIVSVRSLTPPPVCSHGACSLLQGANTTHNEIVYHVPFGQPLLPKEVGALDKESDRPLLLEVISDNFIIVAFPAKCSRSSVVMVM